MRIFKKYKVQIKKKYKKGMSERWKSDKALQEIDCELCMDYKCRDCPFWDFEGELLGCTGWIKAILPKKIYEMYLKSENPKEFFKVLRERAKQYIEWI